MRIRSCFPFFLTVCLLVSQPLYAFFQGEGGCGHLVGLPELAKSLREELLDAVDAYTERFNEYAAIESNLTRVQNPEVGKGWNALTTVDDDVISLGSGPDVLRPLYNFPFAKHIHLVDVLEGWGPETNAGVTFKELERRLHHIGKNTRVTVVRQGFLAERSREELYTKGIYRSAVAQPGGLTLVDSFDDPCTWKVEWESPSAGPQIRYFSLHLSDYNQTGLVEIVLKDLPPGRFGGLLITGTYPPQPEPLRSFLDGMKINGLMIVEMDYDRMGVERDFSADTFIREQIYSSGFYKADIAERSRVVMATYPDRYWPNAYLFRKM